LQALDDLVGGVVSKLGNVGELKNTYVVFTSDNGWQEGEHRIPQEKTWAYEQNTHVPLLIRGPGIRAGSSAHKLTLNTDFFPTFTDLADIRTPNYVDGRSLRSILEENSTAAWRTAILLERRNPYPDQLQSLYAGRSFYGIHTSSGMKYIAYSSGPQSFTTSTLTLTNSPIYTTPPHRRRAYLQA
jgi:N-acetylglucosamine-6-sulfatase